MALVWADRVAETTVTTGTGPFAILGPVLGYEAFSGHMSVGDTCYGAVFAVDANGIPSGPWVSGLLTYSATNQITVTTVEESSNGGAPVSFGPGVKWVILSPTAATQSVAPALNEAPAGAINGSNVIFTLANTPTAAGIALYWNGQRVFPGLSQQYTLSGNIITMAVAPGAGDTLFADYQH